MAPRLALCLLLAITVSAAADKIYKHVDEYGNITYSDEPQSANAEKVILRPINTTPPIEIKAEEASPPTATKEPEVNEGPAPYKLRIASPKDEYQVGPAEQILSVALLTNRKLDNNHFFQLYIDGQPYEQPSKSNNININVRRNLQGRRLITASIVDDNQTVIDSTPAITIYVIRPPVRPRATPR